jgi:hypothetical protein
LERFPESGILRSSGRRARRKAVVVLDAKGEQHGRQFLFLESDRTSVRLPAEFVDFKAGKLFQMPFRLLDPSKSLV